jgi:ABC-type transport system substrate-binding protein
MNDPRPEPDPLDRLVRQASAFATDEDRLAANVGRRIRQASAPNRAGSLFPGLPRFAPQFAPQFAPGLGLALILAVTPFAVANAPLGDADPVLGLLSAFAVGDPGALGLAPGFGGSL